MSGTAKIVTDLRQELSEMKKVGLNVPAKAGWYVSANWKELEAMRETGGMKISEIADYVCLVAPKD